MHADTLMQDVVKEV